MPERSSASSVTAAGSQTRRASSRAVGRVTGWTGIKDDLENVGGIWTDEPAFREGNQVWGRVVADVDFNRELIKALVGG